MNLHTQNRDQATNPNLKHLHKNSFHWRNDSGELDVFEAARYFSAANDQLTRPAARRSLDMPIMTDQKHIKDQSKKFKQPSSPGGRLATFLNSLFNQTPLKKKKKSAAAKDFDEEVPGGGGRRKRRSSISHFRITSTTAKTAAAAADTGSGFRTPPPYAITPTKSYKELARFADGNAITLPKICTERDHGGDRDWIEEKLRISEKINRGNAMKWNEEEDDDGAGSDSSSEIYSICRITNSISS